MKKSNVASRVVALLALVAGGNVLALEEIADTDMSALTAQDGLSVTLATPVTTGVTATRARIDVDNPNVTYPGRNAYMDLEGITLVGVNVDGTTAAAPAASMTAQIDVGAPGALAAAGLSLQASWNRSRMRINALRHQVDATKSMGAIAFDSSGSFVLQGTTGLIDRTGTTSSLRATITDGEWYFRQNSNEFLWDNISANIGCSNNCTVGVDDTGLYLAAPTRFDWNAQWDIGYRASPVTQFVSSADYVPYLRYGWSGGIKNVIARINGGGVWVGPVTSRTEGLNLSIQSDADTDFQWIIGDAGAAPAVIYFTNWVNLPSATAGMMIPNLTLDVINAAQGPGGFVYKGTTYDTPPDSGALAVVMRDTSFLTYNTKVTLHDTSAATVDQFFNWALMYTIGDLDLNLFVYPGGTRLAPAAAEGIRFDLTLGVQSPSTWNKNTHFMIADTDVGKNVGVGFVNTNFLITIDNGYLTLTPTGAEVSTVTDFRWRMDAQFGGGYLSDLSTPVRMFDFDLDLHASSVIALFMPPPAGQKYVGFQWDVRLNQTNLADPTTADSYIAISEPSAPTVKFTFGQMSGDLAVRNGKIDLKSSAESTDLYPRLAFEQDLKFGLTAGTQPVIINNLAIGTNKIGSIALPGGNWFGGFALKQQL